MAKLILWFSGQPDPQLVRATFEHPSLAAPHNVVRGRVSPLMSKTGTFQWTSAVQALAILMLKTAAFQRGAVSVPVIEGTAGSLASSLDFALSKLPAWLVELFGRDPRGYPLARRLIQRGNTGAKRAGPVSLGLSERMRRDLGIEVFLDNDLLTSAPEIAAIADAIESRWRPHHSVPGNGLGKKRETTEDRADLPEPIRKEWTAFRNRIRDEVQFSLRFTDIFSRASLKRAVKEVIDNRSFSKLAGKNAEILCKPEAELLSGDLIHKVPDESQLKRILGDAPIRVAMAAVPSAVTALFAHLKLRGFPIEIDAGFSDAGEIISAAQNGSFREQPEILTFGVAAAATLLGSLKRCEYSPIMLAPKHSARIIGTSLMTRKFGPRSGRFLAMVDSPSSGSFYLEALERDGTIRPNQFSVDHASPAKMFQELQQGDPDLHAVVHFPHHDLNVLFNNCRYLDSDSVQSAYFPGILFGHSALCSNQERLFCVTHALRGAWLELRDNGAETEKALDYLMALPGFRSRLVASAGIAQLREPIGPNAAVAAL